MFIHSHKQLNYLIQNNLEKNYYYKYKLKNIPIIYGTKLVYNFDLRCNEKIYSRNSIDLLLEIPPNIIINELICNNLKVIDKIIPNNIKKIIIKKGNISDLNKILSKIYNIK